MPGENLESKCVSASSTFSAVAAFLSQSAVGILPPQRSTTAVGRIFPPSAAAAVIFFLRYLAS